MRTFLLCSAFIAMLAACPVLAGTETITVTGTNVYWSWLQVPMTANITTEIGSATGVTGNHVGVPDYYRFGNLWLPSRAMTGSPTMGPYEAEDGGGSGTDYWMAITLDQPRWVDYVGVTWATDDRSMVKKYYIEAYVYNDTTSQWEWVRVGESPATMGSEFKASKDFKNSNDEILIAKDHVFGRGFHNSLRIGWRDATNLDNAIKLTLPGEYQSLRVYVEEGDYGCGRASRGGPGIWLIEPLAVGGPNGDGVIEVEISQVNWANGIFGSKATVSPTLTSLPGGGAVRRGAGWLTRGTLNDDENSGRTVGVWGLVEGYDLIATEQDGTRRWSDLIWIDIDLGDVRRIDEVVGLWSADGYGTDFQVRYMDENGKWCDVIGKTIAQFGGTRATSVMFDGVDAQYWQIYGAVFGIASGDKMNNCGFNQILMYGKPIPEPMTMSLLVLGGLAMLRRRT